MPLAVMERTQTHRFEPYRHAPENPLTDVLIIGAGSGNDVTIALAMGAEHVDAVEIDPLLYRLGRDHHPDHPYQDPRVTVHIEDGRSFLHDTERRFDLVLYAIPDSLTVLAGQSSLRLESYLLTREAMREVRDHLKPRRRRLDVPLLPAGGGGPLRGRTDPRVRRSAVPRRSNPVSGSGGGRS